MPGESNGPVYAKNGARRVGTRRLTRDQRIALEQKEDQALRLLVAGATYDAIAQAVGYANSGGAYKAVKRALRRQPAKDAEIIRAEQDAVLRSLRLALWEQAQGKPGRPIRVGPDGQVRDEEPPVPASREVADTIVRIEKLRADLHGTIAPKVIQHGNVPDERFRIEAATYEDALSALAPRPVGDSDPQGPGEVGGDGPPLGEDDSGWDD